MINYEPFWKTLNEKQITTYALINKYHISKGTIHRIKNKKAMSTTTIDLLCKSLKCRVEDIILYVDED